MKHFVRLAAIFLIFSILLPSCASIFSKSVYSVNIDSNPQGRNFRIINRLGNEVGSGKTPQIVSLKSSAGYFMKEEYRVIFKPKRGEREVTLPITFHVDGWYIVGNFFIAGLIGYLLVDPLTGAMWTVDQHYIKANMSDDYSSANPETPTLKVMDINDFKGDKSLLTLVHPGVE